jgi:aspartyl-tRNA(Asn)/glutamyl-tRNA(Gln) amidotransferase subunit C
MTQEVAVRASFAYAFSLPFAMALSPQDVSRIAHLARLELTTDEQAAMLGQLNGFFRIVEQMSVVDTRGVEPLRDDVVTERNDRERNQRSAPVVEDGLFLVPKVIE